MTNKPTETQSARLIPWTWIIRQFAQEIDSAYLAEDDVRGRNAQALFQRLADALQAPRSGQEPGGIA